MSSNLGTDTDKEPTVQRLFEKTFPVRFNVPTPIISDYKGIFEKLFREAFGEEIHQEDIPVICRLYRLYRPIANVREIIVYINELVSLNKMWGDEISLTNATVFLLTKEELDKDPVNQILSGDYLDKTKDIINNNSELMAEISALYYGIPKSTALQVPMKLYIQGSVRAKNEHGIEKYSSHNNFYDILSEVCVETDSSLLPNLIYVLNALNGPNEKLALIWEDVARMQMNNFGHTQELPKEFQTLLSHVRDNTKTKLIERWSGVATSLKDFNSTAYIQSIDILEELGYVVPRPEKKVNGKCFLEAIRYAKEKYEHYALYASPDEVDESLAQIPPYSFNDFEVVKLLKEKGYSDFERLLRRLEDTIRKEELNADNVGQICNTYRCLLPEGEKFRLSISQAKVKTLKAELEKKGKTTIDDGYMDIMAHTIIMEPNISVADEMIPNITKIMYCYCDAENLILQGLAKNSQAYKKVVGYMICHTIGKVTNTFEFLKKYVEIKRHYALSGEQLLTYLSTCEFDENAEIREAKLKEIIPNTEFYKDSAQTQNDFTNAVNAYAVSVLEATQSGNALFSSLKNLSANAAAKYWHQLIENLIDNDCMRTLPKCVEDFAVNVFTDISNTQVTISINSYIKKVLSLINLQHIGDIFLTIRDKYCNGQVNISVTSFMQLERGLRECGMLESRADDVVNKILKPVVNNKDCKSQILKNPGFYKNLINRVVNIGGFKNQISTTWSEEEKALLFD